MKNFNTIIWITLVLGFFLESNGQETQVQNESLHYERNMPRFPGCENIKANNATKDSCAKENMLNYVYQNLRYPRKAKRKKIEGTCIISFDVTTRGFLTNFKIAKDIGSGCGQEALRVIKGMNNLKERWTPGKMNGTAVRVKYAFPVKFKL